MTTVTGQQFDVTSEELEVKVSSKTATFKPSRIKSQELVSIAVAPLPITAASGLENCPIYIGHYENWLIVYGNQKKDPGIIFQAQHGWDCHTVIRSAGVFTLESDLDDCLTRTSRNLSPEYDSLCIVQEISKTNVSLDHGKYKNLNPPEEITTEEYPGNFSINIGFKDNWTIIFGNKDGDRGILYKLDRPKTITSDNTNQIDIEVIGNCETFTLDGDVDMDVLQSKESSPTPT